MMLFCQLSLLLCTCFCPLFACSQDTPRLKRRQGDSLPYGRSLKHTVFFHEEGSDSLFIGGTNFFLEVGVNNAEVLENVTLTPTERRICDENLQSSCENVITVIEQLQGCLVVCGTNAGIAHCWKLSRRQNNHSSEILGNFHGAGISPHSSNQNALSLTVDEDLYAAAPLNRDGTSLQFRRSAGKRVNVWMHINWLTEPTFISAVPVERIADPENEKIYLFFREKNSDSNPEADPWISRVARVCKVDEGGSKSLLQNTWTSFLKARLVCGIPAKSLYFNRLQDVFVQHAEDWRDSRVYALFSSSWNAMAVCIYSMAKLDEVFENSTFKGFKQEIPSPRPGTCVRDSKALPIPTISVIRDHPEMNDWVQPIQKQAPIYISSKNYTKLVVDSVQASDNNTYNVLLLATDTGMIHKILLDDNKPFIISATQLSKTSAPILSIKLDSKKRRLFVGYPEQVSVFNLQRCQDYNTSCQDCVLARDPYCAWTDNGCTAELKGSIQNIATGETHVCPARKDSVVQDRSKRHTESLGPKRAPHLVPLNLPFYMSCPIDSHHAIYTWEHQNHSTTCRQSQSSCLHLIPAMTADNYGTYRCVFRERDHTKVVMEYHLEPHRVVVCGSASRLAVQMSWIQAGLAVAVSTCFSISQWYQG